MLNVLKLPAAIAAATAFASACTTTSGAMLDLADKPAVSETVKRDAVFTALTAAATRAGRSSSL